MSSTPSPEHDGPPRDDSAFRRPGAEPGPSWEPVLDDHADEGQPSPIGFRPPADGDAYPSDAAGSAVGDPVDEPRRPRWRAGVGFLVLVVGLILLGAWWVLFGRTADDPVPAPSPSPSAILQPAPTWPASELTPPSNDASFTSRPEPAVPPGAPDPERAVLLPGDEARAQRIDGDTAVVVSGGQLHHVNLAEGLVNWQVPSAGRVAVSPISGAVVEVAPGGEAISRVVVTGDELSRGRLKGNPALCGDLLFDISESGIDVYDAPNLAEPEWSSPVVQPALAQGEALDCWEDGRHLLIGEHPRYLLRVSPHNREVVAAAGISGREVRVEQDAGMSLIGPFGRRDHPGTEVLTFAEAGGVAVAVELTGDREPMLRAYGVTDGELRWEVAAAGITVLQALGEEMVAVADDQLFTVDLATGDTAHLLGVADGQQHAPDSHRNVCSFDAGDPLGPVVQLSALCLNADGTLHVGITMDGRALSVVDGIWIVSGDGELQVFQ